MNVDEAALELARKIDDIYAQGSNSAAQRTSKIQIVLIDALMRAMAIGKLSNGRN
jgi:hypothetical protein